MIIDPNLNLDKNYIWYKKSYLYAVDSSRVEKSDNICFPFVLNPSLIEAKATKIIYNNWNNRFNGPKKEELSYRNIFRDRVDNISNLFLNKYFDTTGENFILKNNFNNSYNFKKLVINTVNYDKIYFFTGAPYNIEEIILPNFHSCSFYIERLRKLKNFVIGNNCGVTFNRMNKTYFGIKPSILSYINNKKFKYIRFIESDLSCESLNLKSNEIDLKHGVVDIKNLSLCANNMIDSHIDIRYTSIPQPISLIKAQAVEIFKISSSEIQHIICSKFHYIQDVMGFPITINNLEINGDNFGHGQIHIDDMLTINNLIIGSNCKSLTIFISSSCKCDGIVLVINNIKTLDNNESRLTVKNEGVSSSLKMEICGTAYSSSFSSMIIGNRLVQKG